MKHILILLLAGFAGLSSCKPLLPVTRITANTPGPTRIVFATFSAVLMPEDSCKIELIEYQYIEGQIKNNPNNNILYPVEVTLRDSSLKPLAKFVIEHPLIEDLEFTDAQGQLKRMIRTRDTARVYLRFNRFPSMEFIRFQTDNPSVPAISSIIKLKT
jgi:hypothetical protein